MSPHPPAPSVGRFTALVLGLVVFVCVTMIGGTGYLKYQLDRAQTILAAPDNALGSEQDLFDRLRRDWGYGGFLGLAQAYVTTHDGSGFAEMKTHIKSADEIVAHLPDRTSAETRHELTAIGAAYDAALQKINAPGESGEFTAADLAPLYAALPILDARVSAGTSTTRLAAENQMQFWAMLLTLVSWCSLIIAAACAAGIYLTLRDKHSAPMRALAQSIQNMAHGDMRTAIWGIERQDMIGELARAVDMARYQFSHLPDLSLLSDQGPVRMRFEGGTRSLFEAMMKAIAGDSENIRNESISLSGTVAQQKDMIMSLSAKVETILQNIAQHGHNGDQQIRQAISDMVGGVEALKNAHAHTTDQLNRLIPHIQERAEGLAEIAHITGKQIGSSLQSLATSEIGLKTNAENVKTTLTKLSSTADLLGERLFGAINLLQASGKVLAETTEGIKVRFTESGAMQTQPLDLAPLSARLDDIAAQLSGMQAKIETQAFAAQMQPAPSHDSVNFEALIATIERMITERIDPRASADMKAALADLSMQIAALPASAPATPNNGIDLQQQLTPLRDAIAGIASKIDEVSSQLPRDLHYNLQQQLYGLAAQIEASRNDTARSVVEQTAPSLAALSDKMSALTAGVEKLQMPGAIAVSPELLERMNDLWRQLAGQIEASRSSTELILQRTAQTIQEELSKPVASPVYNLPPEIQRQMQDQWFQMSAQIEASRASLVDAIAAQIDKMENRMAGRSTSSLSKTAAEYAAQRQIEQQTQILSELVATLGVLDAHMQQIKSEMHSVSGRA